MTDNKEVALTAQGLKENIVNKVKDSFSELIPEESLEKFVDDTIKEFKEKELKTVILNVLREDAKEKAKQYLSDISYNFDKDGKPIIKELLIEAAPSMLANILKDSSQQLIYNLQNNMY